MIHPAKQVVDSSRQRLRSIISRNKQNERQRKDTSHAAEFEEEEEEKRKTQMGCMYRGKVFKYNLCIKQKLNYSSSSVLRA